MSHIFISYSRQDQDYVALLAEALESHHLPVWLDDHIDYGTTWPRVIREQLERCQLVLVVMSPRSEESHWVQCELTHALEIRKPIFPLLLEGPRWFSVAALQTVDVTGGKLPPARFFDTLRSHLPTLTPTAESLPLQDVVEDSIPTAPAPVGWVLPTKPTTPPNQNPTPSTQDDLSSDKEVDYCKLRDLLREGEWKDADKETYYRMVEAVGRKGGDWIRPQELLNFPCTDLQTIDSLWTKYSNKKWGFSVQKRIYLECGAELNSKYPGDRIWHKFCCQVGWRKDNSKVSYSNLKFDLQKSLEGELPLVYVGLRWGGLSYFLFTRSDTCNL